MKTSMAYYPDGPKEGGDGATSHQDPIIAVDADSDGYVIGVADDESGLHVTVSMSLDDVRKALSVWAGPGVPPKSAARLREIMTEVLAR